MEHQEAEERFSDYWDKSLDEATSAKVKEHLDSCERCRGEYAAFEQMMAPMNRLNKVPAPEALPEAVPRLIAQRSRGRFFSGNRQRWWMRTEWVSLLMLVTLAGLYLLLKWAAPILTLP